MNVVFLFVSLYACARTSAQFLPVPRVNPEVPTLLKERASIQADLDRVAAHLQEIANLRRTSGIAKDSLESALQERLDQLRKKAEREPESKETQAAIKSCLADLKSARARYEDTQDFCRKAEAVAGARATRLFNRLQDIERQLNAKK